MAASWLFLRLGLTKEAHRAMDREDRCAKGTIEAEILLTESRRKNALSVVPNSYRVDVLL